MGHRVRRGPWKRSFQRKKAFYLNERRGGASGRLRRFIEGGGSGTIALSILSAANKRLSDIGTKDHNKEKCHKQIKWVTKEEPSREFTRMKKFEPRLKPYKIEIRPFLCASMTLLTGLDKISGVFAY